MASFETFPVDVLREDTVVQVGSLCMVELSSLRNTTPRARVGTVVVGESLFLLVLQLEGVSLHRQLGRTARLSAGDFTICSTMRPYEISLSAPGRCLVIGIPDGVIRRHLSCLQDVVAIRMPGDNGMSGVLSNFIKSFWTCRTEAADPTVGLRLSYTLLDLIAAAYAPSSQAHQGESSLALAHRVRIIAYIEAHLRDPGLNPTTVAQACKITARYLHHLFASESETVTQFIQRRRLEECARALIAAPVRPRLVTEIALDHGFNSLTHFGRVFRNQYGLTPSEYRRAANAIRN